MKSGFDVFYYSRAAALDAARERGYGLYVTGRTVICAGNGELYTLACHDTGYADWRLMREYFPEGDEL
jgi:hypothetical protein